MEVPSLTGQHTAANQRDGMNKRNGSLHQACCCQIKQEATSTDAWRGSGNMNHLGSGGQSRACKLTGIDEHK